MHDSGASRREREGVCGLDVIASEATQTPSFRGDVKHRTRNLEIPRCAIAHLRSGPSDHPGMTKAGLLRRFAPRNDVAPISNMTPRSHGAMRPRFAKTVRPANQRAQGMPGASCTRSLACETKQSTRA